MNSAPSSVWSLRSCIRTRQTSGWLTSTILERRCHSLRTFSSSSERFARWHRPPRLDQPTLRRKSPIHTTTPANQGLNNTLQPLSDYPRSSSSSSILPKLAFGIPVLSSLPEFPSLTTLSEFLLLHPLPTPSGPSYAITIILLTLLVRTTTTLPTTLWSRARGRRLREEVKPKMEIVNARLAIEVMKECRRAGLGYDTYKVELKKRLAEEQAVLMKQHNCHPLPTILLPPLVHLPIFLLLSLTIRQAVKTPLPSAALTTASEVALTTVDTTTSTLDTTAIAEPLAMFPFANESFLWLPNLLDTDPYLALPFAIGLMAFSNVEVMQRWRGDLKASVNEETAIVSAHASTRTASSSPDPAILQQRRFSTSITTHDVRAGTRIPGSRLKSKQTTQRPTILQSEMDSGNITPAEREKRLAEKHKGGMRERIVGNVLRIVAVCSVGIAAEAPAAVALYWATSTGFTLIQNVILGWMDRRRERRKAVMLEVVDNQN